MPPVTPLPFYAKFSSNLISIVLIGLIIYLGKDILMPICFAVVLAFLLLPVSNWLTRLGVPEVVAMLVAILLGLMVIVGLGYFLSSQIAGFVDDIPKIKKNLSHHLETIQGWIRDNFKFSKREQDKAVQDATKDMQSSGPGVLGTTVLSAASALIYVVLLPIYTFLIMYYRNLIRKFLIQCFADTHKSRVEEVLHESRSIIQSYMVGLLIEMAIVAGLNAAGFLLIGIEYAIFLAVMAAILNMIPYVGMLIATVISMVITLTTAQDLSDILWVGLVLLIVQFIDNNFLMPYVVSSKVKINALVSIVGVLVGGALAGVSGMFLSIPGIAILKAIFDRVEDLKPWGMVLGDDQSAGKAGTALRIRKKAKTKTEDKS
ncbi:MAG: AI-2E family transporter [Pedobacter sp.]|nr:MAG: AI-2E family transporter [Pedobacter sp.]